MKTILNGAVFDVGLMYLIGLVGFAMRRLQIPVAPAVIGLILGPLAEQQLRRALAIADGDVSVLFTRPLSGALLLLAAAVILIPWLTKRQPHDSSSGAAHP